MVPQADVKPKWFEARPAELVLLRKEIEENFQSLRLELKDGVVSVIGTLPVASDGVVVDHYQICIRLPDDFPKSIPIVTEIGGRLPKTDNRHFIPTDSSACLFVPEERWIRWPLGSSLTALIRGPINEFFLGQTFFDLTGEWIFGERSHGPEGLIEFYKERLGVSDPEVIGEFMGVLTKKKIRGTLACPCKSGKQIQRCHGWDRRRGSEPRSPV